MFVCPSAEDVRNATKLLAAAAGVIRMMVDIQALARRALQDLHVDGVMVTMQDVTDPSVRRPGFIISAAADLQTPTAFAAAVARSEMQSTVSFGFAGRVVATTFYAAPEFVTSRRAFWPFSVMLGIVVLTVVVIAGTAAALRCMSEDSHAFQREVCSCLWRQLADARIRGALVESHTAGIRCCPFLAGALGMLLWFRNRARLISDKSAQAAKAAILVAQAARSAHEKTLRYGTACC
jgi:hypothetical protein